MKIVLCLYFQGSTVTGFIGWSKICPFNIIHEPLINFFYTKQKESEFPLVMKLQVYVLHVGMYAEVSCILRYGVSCIPNYTFRQIRFGAK